MLITFSELWITPLFCRKLSTFIHRNVCLCGLFVYQKNSIIYRDRQNAERIFSRQAFMTCFGKIFYLYFHSHFIKTKSFKNRQKNTIVQTDFANKKITDKGKFNGSYLLFDFTFAELYKFIKLLNYYIRFSPI